MSEYLTKLFIGMNDKTTKKQEKTSKKIKSIIMETLRLYKIEGATIYNANGIYTHTNGEQVNENTFIIELLFVDYNVVVTLCNSLKVLLNQESIALQQIELSRCELI